MSEPRALRVIFGDLHILLTQLEADAGLFAPAQLRRRIEALDELDAHLGGDANDAFTKASIGAAMLMRAATLRSRLEAANAEIYSAIREDIYHGNADSLRYWIDLCSDAREDTVLGLGYDNLDELMAGVLNIREPRNEAIEPGAEQVFYQPTPIRHARSMIELSGLSANDLLIDFGSGLGQLCMVASILTGARAIGIELETAYVERARECAGSLQLDCVSFLHADARQADLSEGTVFHLYTPFTGSILQTVLNRLQHESTNRPVTISTLGPCADVVAQEPWLSADAKPNADRVTIFRSGAARRRSN